MAFVYCLSMTLVNQMHWSICTLKDESISVSGSSVDFVLPNSLDESHLTSFCSQIDPLAYLAVIDSLSDEQDLSTKYAAAAQEIVNRMNVFLLQEKGAFGALKCKQQHECLHGKTRINFKQLPLVWDTGASQGLTPFLKDFIHYETCKIEVNDISKVNHVIGIGTVMYKFRASNGDDVFIPGVAFHLPTAAIRLLSPQSYHQRWGGYSMIDGKEVLMNLWRPDNKPAHTLRFPLCTQSNVPTVVNVSCTASERETIGPLLRPAIAHHILDIDNDWRSSAHAHKHEFLTQSCMLPSLTDSSNVNLTSGQKELLMWHWKYGISMSRIQELMVPHRAKDANGLTDMMPCVITPVFKTAATCPIPKCIACELGRARRRPTGSMKQLAVEEKAGILSANQYQPGDFVSMDQFVSGTPGRLFTGYGREAQHNRFQGGTIFNDAASGAIRVEHQVSLGAGETICAKERFEEWLYEQCCAEVKRYHSDNGVFTAAEFREDCDSKLQQQTFSGVGAKHQNGRAERSIQTIMSMARTFMIHVALHWDEQGSDAVALWPFAVRHAVWLHNRLPNAVTGLSPLEILSGTRSDHRDLLRTHVWGCPVYVLDPKLQDGQKIPKWN